MLNNSAQSKMNELGLRLLQCHRLMGETEKTIWFFPPFVELREGSRRFIHAETVLKHRSFNMSWNGGTHTLRLFNMVFAADVFDSKRSTAVSSSWRTIDFFFWLPSYGSMSWVFTASWSLYSHAFHVQSLCTDAYEFMKQW